jgi:hypothetical protein
LILSEGRWLEVSEDRRPLARRTEETVHCSVDFLTILLYLKGRLLGRAGL